MTLSAARASSATDAAPDADRLARELLAIVDAFLAETQGRRAVRATLDSALDRDLGIDSLGRVELTLRIEKSLGERLPEALVAGAETARDLLRAILQARGAPAEVRGPIPRAQLEQGEAPTPDEAKTLVEVLDWHAERHPDRVHISLIDEEPETITYRELRDEARVIAAGLRALGLEAGQSVAIMLPTGRSFFTCFFGVMLAGAIPVPIYPPARRSQIADHVRRQAGILSSCLARVLITVPEAKPVGTLLMGQVASLRKVVTADDLVHERLAYAPVPIEPQDIAFLQYTSGSTGNPKGVILTHANLIANLRAMGRAAGVTSRDVFVSWLPLYHDMGLIGAWFGSLFYAMRLAVMSPLTFLARPSRWLWAIHRERATISAAPNFAFELCATRLDDAELEGLDLSSLRWTFNGAEPVSADTLERFAARFERYGLDRKSIAPVYGLAECALDLAFPPYPRGAVVDVIDRERLGAERVAVPVAGDHPNAMKVVGNGRVLPGYEMRIADASGRELPDRHEGRVEFRGPSTTSGYYRNPEATERLFDGDWLDSGDLGYIAEGELYLTGRAKDVIIRGGHNLYPYELEEAVGNVPGIRKGCVAVFGVAGAAGGTERVVVLAETREQDEAKREALRARINALAVEFLEGPPDDIVLAPPHTVLKTSSGKIRRAASREVYQRGLVGARPSAVWRQLAGLAVTAAFGRVRQALRGVVALLYAAYVWTLFGLVALLGLVAALVLPGRSLQHRTLHTLARALVAATRVPVAVSGLEGIPREGPCVVVANHASYVDGVLLFALLPPRFAFAVKGELGSHFLAARLLGAAGARFVERFDAQRGVEDTRELMARAGEGEALAFFPEGTFTREPGLLPFRMGAFVIGAETGAPVIPVTLRGTRSVLRAGSLLVRRSRIVVIASEPIRAEGAGWGAAVQLRDAARAEILRHCGEPDRQPR